MDLLHSAFIEYAKLPLYRLFENHFTGLTTGIDAHQAVGAGSFFGAESAAACILIPLSCWAAKGSYQSVFYPSSISRLI